VTGVFSSQSEAETEAVGRELARQLPAGTVVLLTGELGAGKTAFVRGMADGLGADPSDVSSPTFTLVQEYRSVRTLLRHADLYRLEPREVDDLGLDEMTLEGEVLAVEWPDRWLRRPRGAISVQISVGPDDRRTIAIER
jgi:tRNA threonylcarbamoyladenosine biosynthesis protein TsaE